MGLWAQAVGIATGPTGRMTEPTLRTLVFVAGLTVASPVLADDQAEAIMGLAGCAACHTADDGNPYAGGHAINTPFGTFYGSNLTPHPEHGLGAWTYADFETAMRNGISPSGKPYWPAFPYTSFHRLQDEDLQAIWSALQAMTPDPRPNQSHDRNARWTLRLWRPLAWRDRSSVPDGRGAYLVETVGHCGECHTPRGALGGIKHRRNLGGSSAEPEPGPNLTPHPDALGEWSTEDWLTFFQMGMTPEGDFVGGEMMRVIQDGTSLLDEEDQRAMADYLRSLKPLPDR